MTAACVEPPPLCRPRDPEASDLWRLLDQHFDCFSRSATSGLPPSTAKTRGPRPIVGAVRAFLKCGDLTKASATSAAPTATMRCSSPSPASRLHLPRDRPLPSIHGRRAMRDSRTAGKISRSRITQYMLLPPLCPPGLLGRAEESHSDREDFLRRRRRMVPDRLGLRGRRSGRCRTLGSAAAAFRVRGHDGGVSGERNRRVPSFISGVT